MLEDRLTPATLHWLGTQPGGFNNPNNWYGTQQYQPPQGGDDLYFGTATQTNSCVIPTAMTLYGIHLVNGYTGTVTVQDETNVGILELGTGGSIAQMGSSATGYDLNVTNIFAFTGGTLNNTSNTGIVHLKNLTSGYIYGGTTTGSTLNIETGTTLKYGGGTIGFANLATMEVLVGSIVLPIDNSGNQQGEFVKINPQPAAAKPPTLVRGGTFICTSDQKFGMMVESGTAFFDKSVQVKGSAFPNLPVGASLAIEGGIISVKNGVTLTVEQGLAVQGGGFFTENVTGLTTGQTVYVIGNMLVSGGAITLGQGVNFGNLAVTGDVVFSGGVFNTKVNGTATSAERDLWRCTGVFRLKAEAKVSPTILYAPPSGVPNRFWEVIISDGLFYNADLPTISTGWEAMLNPSQTRLRIAKP